MSMTAIALLVSVLGSASSSLVALDLPNPTPKGWELTRLADRPLPVTWAAPKGWKLSRALPDGVLPSSLSFEGKVRGYSGGWLNIEALISGRHAPAEILARRPIALTRVTTENGWTCGEEPGTGAEIVCAGAGELVTLVVELGSDSGRTLWQMGGVDAVRKIAPLIKGVWPRGLPQPDADGRLPATEWRASIAANRDRAWVAPKGWRAVEGDAASARTGMSFNATAGAGTFSITALPGLRDVTAGEIPVAEQRIIDFLIAGATTTRTEGWSCGEGTEKASGLPAIVCNQMTADGGLSVSVRAEPAVFATLGGTAAVRSAAAHVRGFHY